MKTRSTLAAGYLILAACSDQCGNQEVARIASPDGALDAVLFQRDCGATTGFSTQVSIVQHGKSVTGSGTVFRADDNHGAAQAGSWGGPWADVQWSTPKQMQIRYAPNSRIFLQEQTAEGVKVTYRQVAP